MVGRPTDLTVTNERLSKRNACKSLGAYVDLYLLSHHHIEYVVSQLNKVSGLGYKVHEIYPSNCWLLFYIFFRKIDQLLPNTDI